MKIDRRVRAVATRVGLTALTVIAMSGAPPPENPTPTQCLDAWARDPHEISYRDDGWPGALVSGPPQAWKYSFFDDTDRNFSLYCGDESSGVVHISGGQTTGHGHPISEADEEFFVGCWDIVIGSGTATDLDNGRTRFERVIGRTRTVAYVDNVRRFTYSVYTSADNWSDCFLAWYNS